MSGLWIPFLPILWLTAPVLLCVSQTLILCVQKRVTRAIHGDESKNKQTKKTQWPIFLHLNIEKWTASARYCENLIRDIKRNRQDVEGQTKLLLGTLLRTISCPKGGGVGWRAQEIRGAKYSTVKPPLNGHPWGTRAAVTFWPSQREFSHCCYLH